MLENHTETLLHFIQENPLCDNYNDISNDYILRAVDYIREADNKL